MKAAILTGLISLLVGTGAGYWIADIRWQSEEAKKNASQARQETEMLRKAEERSRKLQITVEDLQTRRRKENRDARKKYDDLLARINSGDVRVSVSARSCGELPDSERTGANDGKARAELDSKTVGRILAVGRDGDAVIRNLNQCIDQYHALARSFN